MARTSEVYSRRKYQVAVRFLKQAIGNDKLSFTQRLRATELLLITYGDHIPDTKRDARAVKELLVERAFEKDLNQQVRDEVTVKITEQAARDARAYLASLEKQQGENNG